MLYGASRTYSVCGRPHGQSLRLRIGYAQFVQEPETDNVAEETDAEDDVIETSPPNGFATATAMGIVTDLGAIDVRIIRSAPIYFAIYTTLMIPTMQPVSIDEIIGTISPFICSFCS